MKPTRVLVLFLIGLWIGLHLERELSSSSSSSSSSCEKNFEEAIQLANRNLDTAKRSQKVAEECLDELQKRP